MISPGTDLVCTRCTRPIDPYTAFCSSCGAPGSANLTQQSATPPPPARRPPAAADHQQTVHAHGWLLLVAGVAVVAGFFLPWITAQVPFAGKVTANGTDLETWVSLGGGAILVLLALQTLTSEPAGTRTTWPLAFLVALGTAILSAVPYQAVTEQLGALNNQGIRGDYGIGLWLIAGGILLSILATVGGWGATHKALKPTRH